MAVRHLGAFDTSDAAAVLAHLWRVFEQQSQPRGPRAEGRPLFPECEGQLSMGYAEVSSTAAIVFVGRDAPLQVESHPECMAAKRW